MPQSQLWFVNQNTVAMPQVSRTQAQQRRPAAGTILPAVRRSKFGELASSKEYSVGRRGARLPLDPARRSLVQTRDEEQQRSRNYLQHAAQSHSISGPDIYGDANPASVDQRQQAMRPLNQGQNRGKFNQLKSMLQNSERVQTTDDVTILRNNKHVFFDPTSKFTQQTHGMTGFPHQAPGNKHLRGSAGGYDQHSQHVNAAVSELQPESNLMQIRDQDVVSAYLQENAAMAQGIIVSGQGEDHESLDFIDSNIGNETASQKMNEKSVGQIDVQKAFKNRVLQFNQLKSGSFVGTGGVPHATEDHRKSNTLALENDYAQDLNPEQQESAFMESAQSRVPSSLEASPLTQVNRLNQGMYTKLQYNASSMGKRFTSKQPTRSNPTSHLIGNHVVTHHPLFARTNSNITERRNIFGQGGKDEMFDMAATQNQVMPNDNSNHAKLLRQIIQPDNPFAKMTEKDMLIFNPNYHAFLRKLKAKESMSSELSRIIS